MGTHSVAGSGLQGAAPAAAALGAPAGKAARVAAAHERAAVLAQREWAQAGRTPRASAAAPAWLPGREAQALALHRLQRAQGNRAVQRMLAARAPASRPDAANDAAPAAGLQRDADTAAPGSQSAVWGDSVAWRMLDQFAPQLGSIVRQGPAGVRDWLRQRATGAAQSMFERVSAPLHSVAGIGGQLSAQFAPLVASLQDSAAKIAANDCSPISHAAEQIRNGAERIVTPIIEKLQPVVAKVQGFLGDVWDRVGAPLWDWFKSYAGQQWDQLKQLAQWIWALGEPMRSLSGQAWTWLKNKLGMGDGPEGEDGVLQWLQARLESVWAGVQQELQPVLQHIGAVRATLASVLQAVTGPARQFIGLVTQMGDGMRWLAAHGGHGQALVQARAYVEHALIPPLTEGLRRSAAVVANVAGSVSSALGAVAGGLDRAATAVAGSVLSLLATTVRWLADEAHAFAGWASEKLAEAAHGFATAAAALQHFLHSLAAMLNKVQAAASNVWKLPLLLAEAAWNRIPACIRDPVVDFLVPIILRQVELFEELVRDNEAWQKTKAQVMGIVRRVFVDGDLMGAVRAAFSLVLRVFNLPEEMLGKVAAKAAAAWDVVVKQPLAFIKNTVRSLGRGFKLLWTNINTHLEHGIEGWLFGELADKGIHPPSSWTEPRALFGFVVDVLGLSMGHVADLLKKRIDPKLVDRVQTWVGRFSRAWDWITETINTSRSPAENSKGLIDKAADFGKTILTGAVQWVVGKVSTELAELAAAAAASGGLSEVIDVARRVYRAMLSAKRWAGRILQMASQTLDHVLDIAAGNVDKVGAAFEQVMDRGMPVVIGFLADQVGLGGIGAAMRDIVDGLRAKVDEAVLWLIDKVKAGIEALVGLASKVAGAVRNWWETRVSFSSGQHTLYIQGSGPGAQPMVASSPTPLLTFLGNARLALATRTQGPADGSDAAKIPQWQQALEQAEPVGQSIARRIGEVLAVGDRERLPAEADQLNGDMTAITPHLDVLVDLVYPGAGSKPPPAGLPAPATIVKLTGSARLARVVSVGEEPAYPDQRARADGPKVTMVRVEWLSEPDVTDSPPKAFMGEQFWQSCSPWEGSRRLRYLGNTPGKDSDVGKAVQQRLQDAKRMRWHEGTWKVWDWRLKQEYRLDQMAMGHVIDAVNWWNSVGRFTGMRSAEVRRFMNDPANYELEEAANNSARGRQLADDDVTYRPPAC